MCLELLHQPVTIGIHRPRADLHDPSDLLTTFPQRDQADDLPFPSRKRCGRPSLSLQFAKLGADGGTHEGAADGDGLYGR